MWSIPAVTAARSTPIADARSGGALTVHGPANCIAPYPDRLTRLGPSGNVDIGRGGRPGPALRAGQDSDMEFSGRLDGCGRAQGGVHLPDQDLAGFDSTEPTFSSCGKTCSVPRVEQAFRFKVHLAAGDVNVNERRIRDGHAFAGFESRDVQGGVTVPDADSRLVPVPRHRDATTASRPWRSDGSSSSCSYPGATSGSSGTTHIWIRSSGWPAPGLTAERSFFSECRMPVPAVMRCARLG